MKLGPEHIKILRAMTPEQRLRAAEELYDFARDFKSSVLRKDHPEWTPEQVRQAANEWFLYARS